MIVAGTKLVIMFFAALVFDGLVLPAFFGFRESFLFLLFLMVPILYIGPAARSVSLGLFFAFISESLRGLELGSLALPFLFTVVIIYLTQRFLDIKYTHSARFGLAKSILIALMSVVFIFIFSVFYQRGGVNIGYFDPVIGLTIAVETLILVFVFNFVFNKKSDYVS